MKSTTQLVKITPALADKWLQEHFKRIAGDEFKQRSITANKVHQYARDMQQSNWLFNHQGIAFDVEGNLIDGQHRLAAIKLSGVTLEMLVTTGLPIGSKGAISVMDTIDCGRPRSVRDQLRISHEVKEAYATNAIVRGIATILSGSTSNSYSLSVAQTLNIYSIYRDDIEALVAFPGAKLYRQPSWVTAPMVMYHHAFEKEAELFMKQFVELSGMKPNHPILVWTRWCRAHPGRPYKNKKEAVDIFINCIYKSHNNETINSLRPAVEATDWIIDIQGKHGVAIAEAIMIEKGLIISQDSKSKVTKLKK